MNWLKNLTEAMNYIETHLMEEIEMQQVAQIAQCSPYHFQKFFSLLNNDMPLSEYIRNRRLSCAAYDLKNQKMKVIEVALKYGYDSPTAFSLAFKNFHGVSPSEATKKETQIKTFLPISFQINVKGAESMDYTLRKQRAFKALGAKLTTTVLEGKNFQEIPNFWYDCTTSGTIDKMLQIYYQQPKDDCLPPAILGICIPSQEASDFFEYWIAVPYEGPAMQDLEILSMPETTYAVFPCVGSLPNAIQEKTKQIYNEWLPASGYQLANQPDIEINPDGDATAENYYSEIWVPVVEG